MTRFSPPAREPFAEIFNGLVLEFESRQALATAPQPGSETLLRGALVLRYGARLAGKPFLSIVPGLLVLDYGDTLTGQAAWDFLMKKSNLHPRADVVGYRSDGQDDMVMVRTLDLGMAIDVLVYADAQATTPLYRPQALIAANEAEDLPPYLVEYLPRYDSLDAWKAALHV
ncbi:MAG: hypothetical protein HXY40_07600 [Chloroflexi bacterium]|nr:hypothetical protein [Chloroflexota bacterium]